MGREQEKNKKEIGGITMEPQDSIDLLYARAQEVSNTYLSANSPGVARLLWPAVEQDLRTIRREVDRARQALSNGNGEVFIETQHFLLGTLDELLDAQLRAGNQVADSTDLVFDISKMQAQFGVSTRRYEP